ncbi:MAG: hypothetical protein OHK93_007294 [Ramalina farinacea]|uniref:Peptidase M43 pregnancy-associated plasma-A domain-containing protein n=1 Tax=Ramalina farinacea TaxID=258253 RepID=A0AA43QK78_9LECA|nr:hypothetical protein [Ramalina farinacea]
MPHPTISYHPSFLPLLLLILPTLTPSANATPTPQLPTLPDNVTHLPPYISPDDDSDRLIPAQMADGSTGAISAMEAQLCATGPPSNIFRSIHANLSSLRGAEKKGAADASDKLKRMFPKLAPRAATGLKLTANGTALTVDRAASASASASAATATPVQVDTYFHLVVTRDHSKGYTLAVRNAMFANQAKALHDAYTPYNINFTLHPPTYNIRDDWATDAASTDMKTALRQGTYGALNIYFQSNLSSDGGGATLLGYCTLPTKMTYAYQGTEYEYPASDYSTDGCNILAGSMPGSPQAIIGYNEGKTAVHEVGHWFGLLHTFQDNSCETGDPGDYIEDTAQEATSTVGCPVGKPGKSSCGRVGVGDPIHNYMDYSDDACYTSFTSDQTQRMHDMWTLYRSGM